MIHRDRAAALRSLVVSETWLLGPVSPRMHASLVAPQYDYSGIATGAFGREYSSIIHRTWKETDTPRRLGSRKQCAAAAPCILVPVTGTLPTLLPNVRVRLWHWHVWCSSLEGVLYRRYILLNVPYMWSIPGALWGILGFLVHDCMWTWNWKFFESTPRRVKNRSVGQSEGLLFPR